MHISARGGAGVCGVSMGPLCSWGALSSSLPCSALMEHWDGTWVCVREDSQGGLSPESHICAYMVCTTSSMRVPWCHPVAQGLTPFSFSCLAEHPLYTRCSSLCRASRLENHMSLSEIGQTKPDPHRTDFQTGQAGTFRAVQQSGQ